MQLQQVAMAASAVFGLLALVSWYTWKSNRYQMMTMCDMDVVCTQWKTRMMMFGALSVACAVLGFMMQRNS
jgi:phosphoglycerate-specific signal transduction histidine kinase